MKKLGSKKKKASSRPFGGLNVEKELEVASANVQLAKNQYSDFDVDSASDVSAPSSASNAPMNSNASKLTKLSPMSNTNIKPPEKQAISSRPTMNLKDGRPGPKLSKPIERLTRFELFDSFNSPEFFPLPKVKDIVAKLSGEKNYALDFTGVEQLTDVVLYSLMLNSNSSVKEIVLDGCVHLTDRGMTWLATAFPSLTNVSLAGCENITESGLYQITSKCKDLSTINISGTSVAVLPKSVAKMKINFNGCPLISPDREIVTKRGLDIMKADGYTPKIGEDLAKVLIVAGSDVKKSVGKFMAGKWEKGLEPLYVEYDVKLTHGVKVNINECHETLVDMFITKRMIVVLPYESAESDIRDTTARMFSHICYITAKVNKAIFVLLAVSGSKGTPAPIAAVKKEIDALVQAKKTNLQTDIARLRNPEQMGAVGFKEQEMLAKLCMMSYALEFIKIDTAEVNLGSSLQDQPSFTSVMKKSVEVLCQLYPEYQQIASPFYTYIQSNKLGDTLKDGVLSMGESTFSTQKMMEILSFFGLTLTFHPLNDMPVVFHSTWLAKVIKQAFSPDSGMTNSGRYKAVSDSTPAWTKDALIDKLNTLLGPNQGTNAFNILQRLGLTIHPSLFIPLLHLEAKPVVQIEHYFPELPPTMKKKELFHSLRYEYEFSYPVTVSVLYKLMFMLDSTTLRRPVLCWTSGFIMQEGIVEVIFELKKKGNGSCLHMCAHTLKEDESMVKTGTVLKEGLWNLVEEYKLVVEYVLENCCLPYKMTIANSTDVIAKKPAKVFSLTTGHSLTSIRSEEGENGPMICKTCGIRSKGITQAWAIQSTMNTQFVKEEIVVLHEDETVTRAGNILEFKTPVKCTLATGLNALEYPSFKVVVLDGPLDSVKIGLAYGIKGGDKNDSAGVTFDLSNGEVSSSNHAKEKTTLLQIKSLPTAGESISFVLKPTPETDTSISSSDGKHCQLHILKGQELIGTVTIRSSHYFPVIIADQGCRVLVSSSGEAGMGSTDVLPGMRLEAVDRQNKHLVCVATVQEILADGQFLIHFDGWGNNYDYQTDPSSVDLHPVGWMGYNAGQHRSKNQSLQAPRGYGEAFNWPTYCEETGDFPVPFGFFSEEQIGLTEDDKYFECQNGQPILQNKKFASCRKLTNRPKVLEFTALKKCEMSKEIFDFFANHSKFFCLLPSKFDVEKLMYPALQFLVNVSQQNGHILCPGLKLEILHFVDFPGVQLEIKSMNQMSEMAGYLQKCYVGLLLQEEMLPDKCTKLCPGIDTVKVKIDNSIKLLLFHYMKLMELIVSTTEKAGDIVQSEAVGKVFKMLTENKDMKTQFTESEMQYRCIGHASSNISGSDLSTIPEEKFRQFYPFMQKLTFDHNNIERLPVDLFDNFLSLEHLSISNNQLVALPENFKSAKFLQHLDVSVNHITLLPPDFGSIASTLTVLNISDNPFDKFPEVIFTFINLEELYADNIGVALTLKGISRLSKLTILSLGRNAIVQVPDEISSLPLVTLDLSGVPWFEQLTSTKSSISWRAFNQRLNINNMTTKLDEQERQSLFSSADADESSNLTMEEVVQLNEVLFKKYPRFGEGSIRHEKTGGIPPAIFKLTKLKKLNLRYHGIRVVPDEIKALTSLHELNMADNLYLDSMSAEVGCLPMKAIHLSDCQSLKTPPKEIVARGVVAIMGYMKRLRMGASLCRRTKLMMVGLGGAGKTSLVRALTSKSFQAYMDYNEQITDGIDICDWSVPVSNEKDNLTFSVWDFAGQTVYYNTHQFFLSNRAVYLLLWNVRQGYEHAGLDFWLSSIACHAPKAPILVIGTHCDKVEKAVLPEASLKSRFPQIAGFYYVSSYTGEGIAHLKGSIINLTLELKYMGEKIPLAWLSLEEKLKKYHTEKAVDFMSFNQLATIASMFGIFDRNELIQAVQFLHDLGSVQFFDTDFLRSIVVIFPQWIIDVMACLVTVHEGAVKEGRLKLEDIGKVWSDYPKDLHPWLLRLTEEFDLTCPLPDSEDSIVPCLMPDTEPKYDWPHADPDDNVRESMTIYKFQYLPAGLFNRAQVRLYQFSEGSKIWKKGSFLKKKDHIALILQTGSSEVVVRAQGFRPENFLLLVHEMIETLIVENYAGVQYDFLVPCMECQSMYVKEPSMFSHSTVQRATEMGAPFLQCEKFFHILSIPELRESMPSDKMSEIDTHLRSSVRDLIHLTQEITLNVFFCYSRKDVPDLASEVTTVHPGTIMEDLRAQGTFNVSYTDHPETAEMEALTLSVKACHVVMIGMSDGFCDNQQCQKLILFVKDVLRKPILMVLLGTTKNWQKGDLNMALGTEVYVDMQKKERYPHKIKELYEAIKKKASSQKKADETPKCFISYCWSNSHDAIHKGSRKIDGALGWEKGDPRTIKAFLESQSVQCWLDVEKVGGGGLFHSIADGLREAKVMVACVSDEYVKSKNCIMEFRYALTTLRIPVILAIVGTGYTWERSEIGLLAVGHQCTKVNFQFQNEAGNLEILKFVQESLPNNTKGLSETAHKNILRESAVKEVLELTQRKFLRHLLSQTTSQDTQPYPRLIIVDFTSDTERKLQVVKKRQSKLAKVKDVKEGQAEKEAGQAEKKAEQAGGGDLKEAEQSAAQSEDTDTLHKSKYCFRLLCEHEEGWHDMASAIPFPVLDASDEQQVIESAAPFLARIFAILKHGKLQLACLTMPEGEKLRQKLEEIGIKSKSEFSEEYAALKALCMQHDKEMTRGSLTRCVVNGKQMWLCEEHKLATRSKTETHFQGQLGQQSTSQEVIPLPSEGLELPAQELPIEEEEVEEPVVKHRQIFKKMSNVPKVRRQTSQMCSVM